jgi:hypothetical protein
MDDIVIIIDQSKTNSDLILNHINNVHKRWEFKIAEEENNNINCLYLTIHKHNHKLSIEIYRKCTQTNVTIHFTSKHPFEQKLTAFIFCINRMIILHTNHRTS